MGYFTIGLQVGSTAAYLTLIEFVLGTIAAFCLRPIVSVAWTSNLHRIGSVPLASIQLGTRREMLAVLFGTCVAVAVSLVENNLTSVFGITSLTPTSQLCANMSRNTRPGTIFFNNDPFNFLVDDISIDIASQRECAFGIELLDFGTNGTVLAPRCRGPKKIDFPSVIPGPLFMWTFDLFDDTIIRSALPFAILVPQDLNRKHYVNSFEDVDQIEPCRKHGIGYYPFIIYDAGFNWKNVDDVSIASHALGQVCELHSSNESIFLGSTNATAEALNKECVRFDDFSQTCLSNIVSNKQFSKPEYRQVPVENVSIHSVTLTRMSGLFDVEYSNDWSAFVACTDATVQYDYVLVSENFIFHYRSQWPGERSQYRGMVIPMNISVLDGKCENTLHKIGLPAVVYSALSNWTNSTMSKFSSSTTHQIRLHAHLISMARFFYRHEEILEDSDQSNSSECVLDSVQSATRVNMDAPFYFLCFTIILCVLLVCIVGTCTCSLPRAFRIIPAKAEALAELNNLSIASLET